MNLSSVNSYSLARLRVGLKNIQKTLSRETLKKYYKCMQISLGRLFHFATRLIWYFFLRHSILYIQYIFFHDFFQLLKNPT